MDAWGRFGGAVVEFDVPCRGPRGRRRLRGRRGLRRRSSARFLRTPGCRGSRPRSRPARWIRFRVLIKPASSAVGVGLAAEFFAVVDRRGCTRCRRSSPRWSRSPASSIRFSSNSRARRRTVSTRGWRSWLRIVDFAGSAFGLGQDDQAPVVACSASSSSAGEVLHRVRVAEEDQGPFPVLGRRRGNGSSWCRQCRPGSRRRRPTSDRPDASQRVRPNRLGALLGPLLLRQGGGAFDLARSVPWQGRAAASVEDHSGADRDRHAGGADREGAVRAVGSASWSGGPGSRSGGG